MIKPHFYEFKLFLKKYKDHIHALLFTLFIEICILLFIFYYPLKVFLPYDFLGEGGPDSGTPTLYYPHDVVKGDTLDPGNLLDQNAEESDDQDSDSSQLDFSTTETSIDTSELDTSDIPTTEDTLSEDSISQDTISHVTIPEVAIPDDKLDSIEEKVTEKPFRKPKRVRRVRKIIRRVKKRKAPPTTRIFNRASLARARQEVYQGNANYHYGSPNGSGSRYAYVKNRLYKEKMFSYSCKVGKILQSEFARNRIPIVFEEDLQQALPGKIIINRDGTVKDYICENPTGVKEFDEYVKRVIMQSRFRPLPAHHSKDSHEIPFSPYLQANKGTNIFRLYLPEDRPNYYNT